MEEIILMKLGGSLITHKDKEFTERRDVIRRLAREIHEARQQKKIKLIVGHGGGSYPHTPASNYQTNKGIINKESYKGLAIVQDAAARLNRIMVEEFIKAGENAMAIQLSCCSMSENGRIKDMFAEPVEKLLEFGMLPVVYGDVGLDRKQGCCILSTEEILNYVTKKFNAGKEYKVRRVLVCGRVDGVFTANPDEDKNAKLIPTITPKTISGIKDYLAESSGIDVTGGMIHKVERMIELAGLGVECEIINALKEGYIKRALLGEKGLGTVIKSD